MDKHLWLSWAIKNSVNAICWTVLAITFNKWWIASFMILTMSTMQTQRNERNYRVCGKCGKRSPYAEDFNKAIDLAKKAGWLSVRDGDKWLDYCPDCK